MSENFVELIEYLDEKFKKIDTDHLALKSDFRDLQVSVDAYAAKADKFFQELVMYTEQQRRHEKWLLQIADKLGIKLEY